MTRRAGGILAIVVALVIGVAILLILNIGRDGSAPEPAKSETTGPRSLTTEQAERFAVARFLAYQDGSRQFRTAVVANGAEVALQGRVDYVAGIGLAAATLDGQSAVIAWNDTTFVGWDGVAAGEGVPDAAPPAPGGARPLDPTASAIDAVLLMLTHLGVDRPDNAQLLQQSDAAWLRSEKIDGASVDVFSGPSDSDTGAAGATTLYWIDAEGTLLRFEADLPAGTVRIDLVPEARVPLAPVPQLG